MTAPTKSVLAEVLAGLDTVKLASEQGLGPATTKLAIAALEEAKGLLEEKNAAYRERNQLVALLSRLWPAHLADHDPDDASWDREWLNIVCIHSPAGQLTWHINQDELPLFAHLERGESHWDGHSTPEKYERVASIRAALGRG